MPASRLIPPNTPKFISSRMPSNRLLSEIDSYVRAPLAVMLVIYIVLMLIILDYIRKLESTGCVCAADWRRDYINWYVIIVLVWYFIQLIATLFGDLKIFTTITGYGFIPFVIGIMTILFVVLSYGYVNRLKEEKCKCSEAMGRTVLQIVTWWYIVVWALIFVALLIGIMSAMSVAFR